jgi:dihydrofolate reductase
MGLVRAFMSISLDGFVAGTEVSIQHPMGIGGECLHQWLFANPPDPRDAEVAAAMFAPDTTGAVVLGRRTFDVGIGLWGDDGAFRLPCFVHTHRPAQTVVKGPTTFTFTTGDIGAVLREAQDAAGPKAINIMGAQTIQAVLDAGLLDEIHLTLVPVLLRRGTPLFRPSSDHALQLERTRLLATSTVTHLSYHVVA